MEDIELSQEIRLPQEQVKTIQSCSQFTDLPADEYPTLLFKQEADEQAFGEWIEFNDFHQHRSPSLDGEYSMFLFSFIDLGIAGLSEESDLF